MCRCDADLKTLCFCRQLYFSQTLKRNSDLVEYTYSFFVGLLKSVISSTKFSCVVLNEHMVYASTFGSLPQVYVYQYGSAWSLVRSFDVALPAVITLCAWSGIVRCCSSSSNVIADYRHNGQPIANHKLRTQPRRSRLASTYMCDCDSFGNTLIADRFNNQLLVMTEKDGIRVVPLDSEVLPPRSAVLLERRLYVISAEDNAVLMFA